MTHSRTKINAVFLSALMVLSMVAAGAVFAAPAAAQAGTVAEDEVETGGSTVTVNTGGQNSIDVSSLPDGVEVSDVSDSGTYNEGEGSILFANFGDGLPDQVSFTLTPSGFSAGDPSSSLSAETQFHLMLSKATTPATTPATVKTLPQKTRQSLTARTMTMLQTSSKTDTAKSATLHSIRARNSV